MSTVVLAEPLPVSHLLGEVVERAPQAAPNDMLIGTALARSTLRIKANSRRAAQLMQNSFRLNDSEQRCFSILRERIAEDDCKAGRIVDRPVKGFEFDLLDEIKIVEQSVVHVTSPDCILKRRSDNGPDGQMRFTYYQNECGPLSNYMGAIHRGVPCDVCGGAAFDDYSLAPDRNGTYHCPGHFGHRELSGAVFMVSYMNPLYQTVMHLLRCICWTCGEMPGSAKKRASTINAALRCSPTGEPLTRDQRLSIISKAMQNETHCHVCRDRLRCDECRESEQQCKACAKLIEFRPVICNRTKTAGNSHGNSFNDFPQVVTYGVEKMESQKQKAEFAAFKRRHPDITVTERSFNPERSRKMWSVIQPEVALLLAGDLPKGPYGTKGDVFERVFGQRPPSVMLDLRLSAVKAAYELYSSMVSRAIPYSPNRNRPTRIEGGSLDNVHLNEQTKVYSSIAQTDNAIRDAVNHIYSDDNPAMPPLPTPLTDAQKLYGRGDDRHPCAAVVLERGAVLRHAKSAPWYAATRADHHIVANLYGTLQYYVALLIDPSQALKWHPANSSAPRPNSTKPGAESKDKGHSPMTNLKGKGGRFRSNGTGKRVDFAVRDVIVPDPNIDIDELRFPYYCAAKLTKTDIINDFNYKKLLDDAETRRMTMLMIDYVIDCERVEKHSQLRSDVIDMLLNRPLAYLRKYKRKDDDPLREQLLEWLSVKKFLDQDVVRMGRMTLYLWNEDRTKKYDYSKMKTPVYEDAVARRAGSQIDRPPRNGDEIAWNRAPSLHIVSFMAHRIVLSHILPAGMNESVTTPYNADFDGDEVRSCAGVCVFVSVCVSILFVGVLVRLR